MYDIQFWQGPANDGLKLDRRQSKGVISFAGTSLATGYLKVLHYEYEYITVIAFVQTMKTICSILVGHLTSGRR